jgi:hypothetical protein
MLSRILTPPRLPLRRAPSCVDGDGLGAEVTISARSCCGLTHVLTAVTGQLAIDLAHSAHVQKIPVTVSQCRWVLWSPLGLLGDAAAE